MLQRLHSEIRTIMPVLLGACVMLAATAMFPERFRLFSSTVAFVLGCALLGVAVVGIELMYGTCVQLLGLPFSRTALWCEKLIVQLLALGGLSLLFLALTSGRMDVVSRVEIDRVLVAWVAPMIALAAGSLLVVWLRNVVGAFVVLVVGGFVAYYAAGVFIPGLVLAAIAGQWLFRERLVRFEKYSAWDENISLSWPFARSNGVAHATTGACRALIRKELGLQQISLICVVLAFVLPLVFWQVGDVFQSVYDADAYRLKVWDILSAFTGNFVVLLAPLLVGTAAVIEERRQEIHRWQSALPPRRSLQWAVKMAVAIALSNLIGLITLFTVGADLFSARDMEQMTVEKLWIYPAYATATTLLSALIATTASDYIGAMARAVIIVTAVSTLFFASTFVLGTVYHVHSWRLMLWCFVPSVAMYVIVRGYLNHYGIESNNRLLWRTLNGLGVLMLVALLIAGCVFHRTWELFESYTASPSRTFEVTKMQAFVDGFADGKALGPRRRLWEVHWPQGPVMPKFRQIGEENDWQQLSVARRFGFAALKTDGSLWGQADKTHLDQAELDSKPTFVLPKTLSPITPLHRWKKFEFNGARFLGLKEDGSLWIWGANWWGNLGDADRDLIYPTPVQVGSAGGGTDSDWKDIVVDAFGYRNLAQKSDGSLWFWGRYRRGTTEFHSPVPMPAETVPDFDLKAFGALQVEEVRYHPNQLLAKLRDGRVVARRNWDSFIRDMYTGDFLENPDLGVLDAALDWERISYFDGHSVNAITKSGGWIQHRPGTFRPLDWLTPIRFKAVDLETDWVAVGTRDYYESLEVKRDGSLWYAGQPNHEVEDLHSMIIPPRFRPQLIGHLPVQFFEPERKAAR